MGASLSVWKKKRPPSSPAKPQASAKPLVKGSNRGVALGGLAVEDVDLGLARGAFEGGEDEEPAVARDVVPKRHVLVRVLEDQRVLVLRVAQAVEVDLAEIVLVARGDGAGHGEALVVSPLLSGVQVRLVNLAHSSLSGGPCPWPRP